MREFKSPDTFVDHYDPMESRSNGNLDKLWQFRSAENNEKYTAVRNVQLARFYAYCTSKTHRCTIGVPSVHRRIPGNVPGRTLERTAAAAAAAAAAAVAAAAAATATAADAINVEIWWDANCSRFATGTILHVAIWRRNLSRTPTPREDEFHDTFLTGSSVSARALSRKAVSAQCWNSTHKCGPSLYIVRERGRDTGKNPKRNSKGKRNSITFVCHAWRKPHHEITDVARWFAIREPRDRRGHSEDITMSADWLLGTVYTWQCGSSTSDRRRLPEGTETAAV